MGGFLSIRGASQALQSLLRSHVTDTSDPYLGGVPVELKSPKELREESVTLAISLWLYQVERNAELTNAPRRRNAEDALEWPPFPANLHYLVTPIAPEAHREHALLGRVIQVLHDHASMEGVSLEGLGDPPFKLSFQPMSLEEITRIWDALKEPYQLSVAYLVQLVRIDSARDPVPIHSVRERRADVGGARTR